MERDNNAAPVELMDFGSVTGETKGNLGRHWEATGLRGAAGLSDE